MRHLFFLILLCLPLSSLGQNAPSRSFYLNISGISTWGSAYEGDVVFNPDPVVNWSVYCGNDFPLNFFSENLQFSVEFYYLNNNFVISAVGDDRFELHQNLGVNFKPGYSYSDFTTNLIVGVNAFYLFDKNEASGYQIDRFDNSMFFGIEQVFNLNDYVLISFGYSISNFERKSFYMPVTLTSISILKLGVGIRI